MCDFFDLQIRWLHLDQVGWLAFWNMLKDKIFLNITKSLSSYAFHTYAKPVCFIFCSQKKDKAFKLWWLKLYVTTVNTSQ